MIEPVRIKTTNVLKGEMGTIFFLSPDTEDEYKSVGLIVNGARAFWIINRSIDGRGTTFWIGHDSVSINDFFDYVAQNHADYFEYILFHHEWLQ